MKWVKSPKIAEALLKKFHDGSSVNFGTAVQFEMYGIMEHFIQNDPNIINYVDPFGGTYLHFAVGLKIPKTIELMIKNGFNVNAKGHNNITPLHMTWYGPSIKTLIACGANIYAKSTQGMCPFEVSLLIKKADSFKAFVMNM